jgi:hypothetical protein
MAAEACQKARHSASRHQHHGAKKVTSHPTGKEKKKQKKKQKKTRKMAFSSKIGLLRFEWIALEGSCNHHVIKLARHTGCFRGQR